MANLSSTTNTNPLTDKDDSLLQKQLDMQRTWQQALESLYMLWIQEVRRLATQWNLKQSSERELLDTYFYACGKGHVILFGVGIQEATEGGNGDEAIRLVPEILVSSSSIKTRDKLRAMGVRLTLLVNEEEDGDAEFREESVRQQPPPAATSLSPPTATEATTPTNSKDTAAADDDDHDDDKDHAELAALRIAQVFGQTAGADVSVKPRGGSTRWTRSPRTIPPLVVTGMDDCASFVEVYLNTMGQICSTNSKSSTVLLKDVPRLMCRKLGPFLHSSMQSYRITKKKQTLDGSDNLTSIDVQGLLLPCAVRDLVCAAVNGIIAKQGKHGSDGDEGDGSSSDSSHNLIVRASAAEREESTVVQGTIGSPSSLWLNGGSLEAWNEVHNKCKGEQQSSSTQRCQYGEVLNMAVWDSTRPTSLAYKLDYIASSLLG